MKGLEFPVVIVADIDRKGPPRGGDAILHPILGPLIKFPQQFGNRAENLALRMHILAEQEADADETIRLFYVACTRAADYLILSAGFDADKSSHSPWLSLVESRFDLRPGCSSSIQFWVRLERVRLDARPFRKSLLTPSRVMPKLPRHRIQNRFRSANYGSRIVTPSRANSPYRPGSFLEATDLSFTSVSRLETIDEELRGVLHSRESRRTDVERDEVIDLDMATTLGTIVHSVLERVDFQNPASWPQLLEHAAKENQDKPKEEMIQQAYAMLERFFDSALADELARARTIHREIDFLLPWPSRLKREDKGHSRASRPAR